jgi:hypothetical protein
MRAVKYDGQPENIASIVSYLASKEAHFITGESQSTRVQFTSFLCSLAYLSHYIRAMCKFLLDLVSKEHAQ